jgi:hypothetical protein
MNPFSKGCERNKRHPSSSGISPQHPFISQASEEVSREKREKVRKQKLLKKYRIEVNIEHKRFLKLQQVVSQTPSRE